MTCWVRSASLTDSSVGRASASSIELVWRLCVPPSTAARACRATRTTLFIGCCAVSVTPPVWVWKRSICAFSRAPEFLLHDPGPDAPAGPELGDLLEEVVVGGEEEGKPGSELVDLEAGVDGRADVFDGVGEGECQLLDGGGARLADVVPADGNGVPVRDILPAEGKDVGDDAQRGPGGKYRFPARCIP